jgi:hypothetical protein
MSEAEETAMFPLSPNVLQSVLRASQRSSASLQVDMGRHVSSLATIASTAPLVGFLGTAVGMVTSFHGCGGERSFCMAILAENLSQSIWPTALGLLIGVLSHFFYSYLNGRLQLMNADLEKASHDLVDYLRQYRGSFILERPPEPTSVQPMFGEEPIDLLTQDAISWRWSIFVAGFLLCASWFIHSIRYFSDYSLTLPSVGITAFTYVLFTFGLSFFLAYPIWVALLRRRRGGLLALSAGICACWSAAKLIWGDRLP